MEINYAKNLIEKIGFRVRDISKINEGNHHYNFLIGLNNGKKKVVRFGKSQKDPTYGGKLSLEREKYLCGLAREIGLRSPEMNGPYEIDDQKFLIAEKLPGVKWNTYLENHNHSLNTYLQSMRKLGGELAKAHSLTYDSFGDIMQQGIVTPNNNNNNFATRLEQIIDWKLRRMNESPAFTDSEQRIVINYLKKGVEQIRNEPLKSSFLITDLHPGNILVDEEGDFSWPDLEWCQASPPQLDMYLTHSLFTAYFDTPTFSLAKDALFEGYHKFGGEYDQINSQNLELIMRICHTTGSVVNYHNQDGFRKNWSKDFKEILFNMIESGDPNYVEHSDVFRSKTGQPKNPTLP